MILDCCCGTADQAISLANHLPDARIIGIDISENMLTIGRSKVRKQSLENRIDLQTGNVDSIAFGENTFDVVSMSFGLRNIENKRRSLDEIERVMKPGAQLLILEFSPTPAPIVRGAFRFYRGKIMPAIGGGLSGSPGAYRYLSSSIEGFLPNAALDELLQNSGFTEITHKPLAAGIAALHSARSI